VHKLSKKEITFQDDFKSFLKEMPSISFSNDDSVYLDVDVILEKISERGVDSLSRKEKEFLDSLK
jgi:hypothetical protein